MSKEYRCTHNALYLHNGLHDCKSYIENYQDLHYGHGLQTAVNIALWWLLPQDQRLRQELELSLILKWRSPFNYL